MGEIANPFALHGDEPPTTDFLYVLMPAAIAPDLRDSRFGDPLDAKLRLAGIGYVSGGGQSLSAPDGAGGRTIVYCGVDVDTIDREAARALLRLHLPELGCPVGTCVQFGDAQDRYDGETWRLDERRDRDG